MACVMMRAIVGTALWLGTTGAYAQQPAAPKAAQTPPAAAAKAEPAAKSEPATKPEPPNTARMSAWPKLAPAAEAKKVPERWSEADIADAQKSCIALLKGLDIVAVGVTPILDGSECGAVAPIELISVGTSPQVTFSPPVTVTCDMAAALHGWITKDVQASAKKHLGAPIVRIDTMSSYSCRTAYGRANHKLSEHGRANAVDIRAFMTAKADTAVVLDSWGPTARDIQAHIAAAKAADERTKALAAAKAAPSSTGALPQSAPNGTAAQPPPAAIADVPKMPTVIIGTPGAGTPFPTSPSSVGLSSGFPPASRLGGPKPPAAEQLRGTDTTAPAMAGTDKKTLFLREVHTSACKVFGTILGPEANNAHRNHFHVDMAKRARASFCE